jgi:hypothetical protein
MVSNGIAVILNFIPVCQFIDASNWKATYASRTHSVDQPSCHLSHRLYGTPHALCTHTDISVHKSLLHDSQSSDANELATVLGPP